MEFFVYIIGATREIGACLTRIVLRHKAMESRMKTLCSALLECMILPLQDKLEDWRKNVGILDKEHAKEYKKVCHIENFIIYMTIVDNGLCFIV